MLEMAGWDLDKLDQVLKIEQREAERASNLKKRREAQFADDVIPQDADDVL